LFCVYILKCADGTFYTGATKDLERRIAEHNSGRASKYTRMRLPVELHYWEETPDWSASLKREAQVKKFTHRRKSEISNIALSDGKSSEGMDIMPEKITTLHPEGKKGVNIDKDKYEMMKDAILAILHESGEITFGGLMELIEKRLAGKFDGSISWYCTNIKLDLEARKTITVTRLKGRQTIRV